MNELRLRFSDGDQPDLVLGAGVHALGRLPTGLGPVDGGQPWLLQLCNDRRGIWLTVADELRGVHVNGRPVQHVAMLRAGDSIHVDGNELLLTAASDGRRPPPAGSAPRDPIGNLRLVLRGVGGAHHGRSISLAEPRRIGRASDADIRIEGPGIAERHAVIEAINGHAMLRDAEAGVLVNGQRLGMVTAGQFLTETPDPSAFRERALATGARIGVDGEALAATHDSLEIVSAERALQITALLAVIANALSGIGYQGYLSRQALAQIAAISVGASPELMSLP